MDLSVIEALQVEAAAGSEPRQGLLFGQTGPAAIQLDEWHRLASLQPEMVAAALRRETRNVLGYYVIREGSAFILSPAEVALAQEFFRKPGSVVLLVERRKRGPSEATFYFWRGDVFVHNLPLPFPLHAGILSGETPGPTNLPAAPRHVPAVPSTLRRRVLMVGLYAASAVAAAGIVITQYRHQPSAVPAINRGMAEVTPPAEATWIRTEPKRDLELTWDARAEAVSTATAGVLKIEDAGATRQMSLDVGELLMGTILYAPASDRIRVELKTLQRDGRMMPVVVAAMPATSQPSAPVAEIPPVLPAKKTETPAIEPPAEKKADVLQQASTPRPPLKRFTWSSADRITKAPAPALEEPHQALPVVNPAVLTAELPNGAVTLPVMPAPPPPKPTTPTTVPSTPVRAIPRSGRLIWAGTLLRRGIVELDGRSVSVGSLVSGSLPGVPVNVTVTPAEFGDDGLMVYTTDATRHNRVEPPSAGNGWNKVTYVWAPERVREIAVLEAPNPGNNFSRLAVRSDARRCSMLLIDWNLR